MVHDSFGRARGLGSESGHYYYRARNYNPSTGTFISADPVGFLGRDFNFYRYVGNNPLAFTDSSGFLTDNQLKFTKELIDINEDLKKIDALIDMVKNPTNSFTSYCLKELQERRNKKIKRLQELKRLIKKESEEVGEQCFQEGEINDLVEITSYFGIVTDVDSFKTKCESRFELFFR